MMKNFTQLYGKTLLLAVLTTMGFTTMAKDTTPPVINLNTPDTLKVQVSSVYTETTPTITDNQSDVASITVNKTNGFNGTVNTSKRGWYAETYEAIDSNGNKSSKTRTVIVDDFIKPDINLNTAETVYHKIHTPYISVNPTVTDNYYPAGQVSLVKKSSDVDVNVAGIYHEVFEAVDGSGNVTDKTRTVIVGDQVSVNSIFALGVSFGPNPANAGFGLNIPAGLSLHIVIMSLDGKVILEQKADASVYIETSALSNGVYTIQLSDGQRTSSAKFMVQH